MPGWNIKYTPNPAEVTALKCATLLLILFYGEPDLVGAFINLIGRLAT